MTGWVSLLLSLFCEDDLHSGAPCIKAMEGEPLGVKMEQRLLGQPWGAPGDRKECRWAVPTRILGCKQQNPPQSV